MLCANSDRQSYMVTFDDVRLNKRLRAVLTTELERSPAWRYGIDRRNLTWSPWKEKGTTDVVFRQQSDSEQLHVDQNDALLLRGATRLTHHRPVQYLDRPIWVISCRSWSRCCRHRSPEWLIYEREKNDDNDGRSSDDMSKTISLTLPFLVVPHT